MRTLERRNAVAAPTRGASTRHDDREPAATRPFAAPHRRATGGCACGGGCRACARPSLDPAALGATRARLVRSGDEDEADRFADAVAPVPQGQFPRARGAATTTFASPASALASGGRALDPRTRRTFEDALGADLSRVRLHDDATAAAAAASLHADAFTLGEHIVFGGDRHRSDNAAGRHLLAHELAHTVQQGASPLASSFGPVRRRARRGVQGSFWDDVASGVAAVGRAIGSAASAVGNAIGTAVQWVGERVRDVAQWAINLVTELPARLLRLGQALVEGFWGVITFIPQAVGALASGGLRGLADFLWERLKSAGAWSLQLVTRILDVIGFPEMVEFAQHLLSHATPLTEAERRAGQSVLGENAVRWDQVRVAEGGYLHLVFAANGGRAFTTFHTINIPASGAHGRSNTAIVVHELTHVMQYERSGSWYIGQAIHAQATVGYGYGGASGLRAAHAAGRHFASFNREQQAQIAQDYYTLFVATGVTRGPDFDAYQPFIAELRAGVL